MRKTPENLEAMEGENTILTPSEIGALSPRVPRRPEMLREAPKPIEAKIYDADENEIVYLPEAIGDATPGAQFIKKGDRAKKQLTFRGKTKDGKVVLENEEGEGIVITSRDFESGYERLRRVYAEKTKEGRTIELDTEVVLKESIGFYTTHELKDFLKDLPKEIRLSAQSEARLREALREGFDKAMLLPSTELQKGSINKLIGELVDKPYPGLSDADQYTVHYMHQPDTTKAATPRNRPARKAYLLLYQSGPIPNETRDNTPNDLDPLFTQKKWNGLTLEEYLMIQRKELEAKKNHSFDAYSDTAAQSQWSWLLDSRVPRGVVHAHWSPGRRQVRVNWYDPGFSSSELGARPAVVVPLEVGN